MLLSIENLLNALDEHQITYCHWKSNEHLKEALNGDTDLDMLFEPSQRREIEHVFAYCGLKRFRATPLMQYNAIEDFIGFDQEALKIWHVHTHYRITLGEKHLKGYTITPWGKIILKDRIKKGESVIWTSEASEELVLLFCRIALKLRWRDIGRKLSKDERTEMKWLMERVTRESVSKASKLLVNEKAAQIIDILMDETLDRKAQFKPLQKSLRKELKLFTSYSKISSYIIREKRELFWLFGGLKRRFGISNFKANRRVSPSGGFVVAILGCDGAGKSTTLAYVLKEFTKKLDAVSIYFGSGEGSSSLLRKPMKMMAQKIGGKGVGAAVEKEYAEKREITLKSQLYSYAKIIWAVTLAQEKKKKQRQMVEARNNGLLVLTDRYPHGQTDPSFSLGLS